MATSTAPAVPDHDERALPHPDPRMLGGESPAPGAARVGRVALNPTIAAGQPTGSTKPLVDDHIIATLAIIVVGALAAHRSGYLGHWWSNQLLVPRSPWLR